MNRNLKAAFIMALVIMIPLIGNAQSGEGGVAGLHAVLDNLYDEMMPLCGELMGVGQGIAGFAAIWYIASRVWRHIANAEPVDFYPLFRPFVLGFCIIIFPSGVIGMINGVLQPTVAGTSAMVKNSDKAIAFLLKQKQEKLKGNVQWKMYVGEGEQGDRDLWYKYTHDGADPEGEGMWASVGNDLLFAMDKAYYNFKNSIKQWMSEVLQIIFQAASLCINTLRTFQLIVLAILGPLVFGIATFDGFQHTLIAWLARYINIFLWLPVANIFGAIIGKIQEQMLKLDINQIGQAGETFFSESDIGYLVFMIIGIVGYFTVPSVANAIVHAGGLGSMLSKVTSIVGSTGQRLGSGVDNISGLRNNLNEGYSGSHTGSGLAGAAGRAIGSTGAFMQDKLKGNS